MATVLCSAQPSQNANTVDVVAYGFSVNVPLGVCQSFAAFQAWIAANTTQTVPGADQGGWTDLMSGAGVTMGA